VKFLDQRTARVACWWFSVEIDKSISAPSRLLKLFHWFRSSSTVRFESGPAACMIQTVPNRIASTCAISRSGCKTMWMCSKERTLIKPLCEAKVIRYTLYVDSFYFKRGLHQRSLLSIVGRSANGRFCCCFLHIFHVGPHFPWSVAAEVHSQLVVELLHDYARCAYLIPRRGRWAEPLLGVMGNTSRAY